MSAGLAVHGSAVSAWNLELSGFGEGVRCTNYGKAQVRDSTARRCDRSGFLASGYSTAAFLRCTSMQCKKAKFAVYHSTNLTLQDPHTVDCPEELYQFGMTGQLVIHRSTAVAAEATAGAAAGSAATAAATHQGAARVARGRTTASGVVVGNSGSVIGLVPGVQAPVTGAGISDTSLGGATGVQSADNWPTMEQLAPAPSGGSSSGESSSASINTIADLARLLSSPSGPPHICSASCLS